MQSCGLCFNFSESECDDPLEILDSSSLEPVSAGKNILESCNNELWRAPDGEMTELIFDLQCPKELETFTIMNAFGSMGMKKFSLHGSQDMTGPWTELFRGELKVGNEMTEEVTFIL